MVRNYSSRDPLVSREYSATINAAGQLVLRPTSPIDRLLKATYFSRPYESLDEFVNRVGLKPRN